MELIINKKKPMIKNDYIYDVLSIPDEEYKRLGQRMLNSLLKSGVDKFVSPITRIMFREPYSYESNASLVVTIRVNAISAYTNQHYEYCEELDANILASKLKDQNYFWGNEYSNNSQV